MATTSLSIKYRPIRIGFLVRDGSIEDLVKVAGINAMLWGGIRNPIIPISPTKGVFAKQLLALFAVDVLYAVAHTPQIDEVIRTNPYLRDPGHYGQDIFFEDWETKKSVLGYLDSINIVNYYWEKELKHKPKDFNSNCALARWDDSDPCKSLFSLLFGFFPTSYNLKHNFEQAFVNGLRSKEITIPASGPIDSKLATSITPLDATSLELSGYEGSWRSDGLYVGSEDDFTDLLYFWNLRAAGLALQFAPRSHISRFDGLLRAHTKRLHSIPNRNPNIRDWITAWHRNSHEEVVRLLEPYEGDRPFSFAHCTEVIWNGLNVKAAAFYFDWQRALANVEKSYDRYSVSAALPDKKFVTEEREKVDRNFTSQQLAVSIDPIGDFGYPGHTLKPPFLPALNEFYSREIQFDPWRIRSERHGIGLMIKVHDDSLSLFPIAHHKLIEKILELAGFRASTSQAGLLAKQIVQSMREDSPLEACRVFKITGVRKLIGSLNAADSIEWGQAIKTIGKTRFDRFKKLYIESRDAAELTPIDAFQFLLSKKVFAPKLKRWQRVRRAKWNFKCKNCGLEDRILVKEFEGFWRCPYCEHQQFMPSYIPDSFKGRQGIYWNFKRSGLFAKDNNQEGAVPVIVSLLVFARLFEGHKLIYSTSLNLKNSIKTEVDFCVLQYERGENIQLAIAECKSEGQKITKQDVENLRHVQDAVTSLGIECYIIFAKTADQYETEEIELFRALQRENRLFVILSNQELEPYHPYWELPETEHLPEKYALTMMGMHRNSVFLYLK